MNELIIRFDKKTHKLSYLGIATPTKKRKGCTCPQSEKGICNELTQECKLGKHLKTLYGNSNAIWEPVPDDYEEEEEEQ